MKKEDRKIIKEITKHKDIESNLPAYANAYINATYQYSLIHLVLNYYTMKEVQDDAGEITRDEYLSKVLSDIHTLLFQTLFSDDLKDEEGDVIKAIHSIREDVTKRMTILTAYTDALQIYEYVLNRIEYGITKETYPVEESALAAKVFQYLFRDNDKMVVNSKIQMVTGQLPIRMTKNRFFEYLTNTLNIYCGADQSSVDDFVAMLKSSALLELPEGYEDAYPEITQVIQLLEQTDYKTLDFTTYQALMEQFSMTTSRLTALVSDYLLLMEIINDFYAVLLARPYVKKDEERAKTCVAMLKGLHAAFLSEGEIPEVVDEGFEQIEGVQEQLGEDILQFESILQDVVSEHKETVNWLMIDKIFANLLKISKLLSNSLFIDLDKSDVEEKEADSDYIAAKNKELVVLLNNFFGCHSKEINRAVMASMFSNMPVLFNSQQEIKDYIEYSLNHCSNESELMACAKILEEMMEEE